MLTNCSYETRSQNSPEGRKIKKLGYEIFTIRKFKNMDFNIEVRKRQLKSLKQYIASSEDNAHAVLNSLGWNANKTLEKEDPKVSCTVNKNHLISFKTLDNHIERCTVLCLGYDNKDEFLSEVPKASSGTIKLENKKKVEILTAARCNNIAFKAAWNGHEPDPMTSNRLLSTFSPDERLTLYDYCVKNTEPPPKPEEFTLSISDNKEDQKELTLEEQLAKERDAKRRRTKYKSVHTSRKNQTEIMREVIDNQMTLYNQWLEQKQEKERKLKQEQISYQANQFQDQVKPDDFQNNKVQSNHDQVKIETQYNPVPGQTNVTDNLDQWAGFVGQVHDKYYQNSVINQEGQDWSQYYQEAANLGMYSGSYQTEQNKPIERSKSPINSSSSHSTHTNTSKIPKSHSSNLYNVNTDLNHSKRYSNKEYHQTSSKKRDKEYSYKDKRAHHNSYKDSDRRLRRSRSKERDMRHDSDRRGYRSTERRYEKDRRH